MDACCLRSRCHSWHLCSAFFSPQSVPIANCSSHTTIGRHRSGDVNRIYWQPESQQRTFQFENKPERGCRVCRTIIAVLPKIPRYLFSPLSLSNGSRFWRAASTVLLPLHTSAPQAVRPFLLIRTHSPLDYKVSEQS